MSDARCPCECESPCVLNEDLDRAEQRIAKLEAVIKQKDEAIASARPEPSRLEIAAMLKAGWFANRDADFNATDHKWWIEQADKLIATAREAK